jgi:hypothetical protein
LLHVVLQACFLALAHKRGHRQKDSEVDEHCKMQHDIILPQPNLHPRDLKTLKRQSILSWFW